MTKPNEPVDADEPITFALNQLDEAIEYVHTAERLLQERAISAT
jgi:hypothetical protein